MSPFLASPRLRTDPPSADSVVRVAGRIGWAGPKERALWAPRLKRLRAVALAAELALAARGRFATIATVDEEGLPGLIERAGAGGLHAVPIAASRRAWGSGGDGLFLTRLLLAAPDRIAVAAEALNGGDRVLRARTFGYPPCCAEAWAKRPDGSDDAVAPLVPAAGLAVASAHLLLPSLGIGPLRHAPCGFGCAKSAARMAEFASECASIDAGAGTWLDEMAQWHAEWSARSGVAEVKTPFFRYEHRVSQGANGRASANRPAAPTPAPPVARPKAPAASVVRFGAGAPVARGWHEAGFDSPFAMRSLYCAIVWQWTRELRGRRRSLLHLRCADGALLEIVGDTNPRLRLRGVEADPGLVAHARERLDGRRAELAEGDWTSDEIAAEAVLADPEESAVFLDVEPLADLEAGRRRALVERLVARHQLCAVYASNRGLRRFGTLAAAAEYAGLKLHPAPAGAVSAAVAGPA